MLHDNCQTEPCVEHYRFCLDHLVHIVKTKAGWEERPETQSLDVICDTPTHQKKKG
jgi:hypothetical protein